MNNSNGLSITDYSTLARMSDAQLTELFGARDYYTYEADFGTINSGANGQYTLTIQADSNFLWQYGNFFVDIAGAAFTANSRPIPNISYTLQDSSSGRQLMSGPVPIASAFGTGQEPFELPSPRFFRANTTITLIAYNFDAAVNYDLRLSLIGTKFMKYGSAT